MDPHSDRLLEVGVPARVLCDDPGDGRTPVSRAEDCDAQGCRAPHARHDHVGEAFRRVLPGQDTVHLRNEGELHLDMVDLDERHCVGQYARARRCRALLNTQASGCRALPVERWRLRELLCATAVPRVAEAGNDQVRPAASLLEGSRRRDLRVEMRDELGQFDGAESNDSRLGVETVPDTVADAAREGHDGFEHREKLHRLRGFDAVHREVWPIEEGKQHLRRPVVCATQGGFCKMTSRDVRGQSATDEDRRWNSQLFSDELGAEAQPVGVDLDQILRHNESCSRSLHLPCEFIEEQLRAALPLYEEQEVRISHRCLGVGYRPDVPR
mmetsp:Transcript_78288/g.217429  ORF Transcript_78288/g.217429 Transcript_78288/m.217429 type:complete len:327 (-) Transcript_78288:899-1879(-)